MSLIDGMAWEKEHGTPEEQKKTYELRLSIARTRHDIAQRNLERAATTFERARNTEGSSLFLAPEAEQLRQAAREFAKVDAEIEELKKHHAAAYVEA